jgi:predicted enzyme related to lactoylglutathione lyase
MTPHGLIHWTELNTHDPEKAKSFFGEALGWTFEAMPMADVPPYHICMSGGEVVGGLFMMTDPMFAAVPEHWMTYFAVDDVDASVEKAKAHGGTILREPYDVRRLAGSPSCKRRIGGGSAQWLGNAC